MSAINRFHEVPNDALVMISDNLVPGAKLIGAKEEHLAALEHARAIIQLHRA
ncbi:hypothetical protein [Pseudomonas sp. EZ-C24]|uniref:hypothetical protein n=1 Tax=Pseudomonas sp. EZ-C24 TaxID=2753617 RepID=UPI00165E41E4|nr:hypothetical protein [Pseudomonas sp. EZ-C24]